MSGNYIQARALRAGDVLVNAEGQHWEVLKPYNTIAGLKLRHIATGTRRVIYEELISTVMWSFLPKEAQ